MAKKLKTVLTFVQDETGSMLKRREATISAFNEYFDTLKKSDLVGDVEVVVWQFSDAPGEDRVRLLHEGALAKVPKLKESNYSPRGITPLLDAVGTALQQADQKKADRYLFIVQTDGLENASRDFTREQVAKLVQKKEKAKNWTVVFLGAGVNQWKQEAGAIGANAGSTFSYPGTPVATASAYRSMAGQTVTFLATDDAADKDLGVKAEADMKKKDKKEKT